MNEAPLQSPACTDSLGRPMHDLRISVTDRCNFRCPYCMPADRFPEDHAFLPRESLLSFEEIVQVAQATAALGVEKLRLTGGEPLLRRDLPRLVAMLAKVPGVRDIALTTNGVLLPRHAQALRDAGLHRVTVSLDALTPETFERMSGGRASVGEVLAGIDAARNAGFAAIKLNCVVIRGQNEEDVVEIAARFRGTGIIVRFIEYMDVGTLNQWMRAQVAPARDIVAQIHQQFPLHPLARNYAGEVASRYGYDDGAGEIGIIASVTQPFCGDCSRLRMSAEGKLYTCLFAHSGVDVRDLLRGGATQAELTAHLRSVWRARADRYSEVRHEAPIPPDRVQMYHVGG